MLSYARANVRITIEKKQKENSHEGITWSEIGNKMYKLKRSIEKAELTRQDLGKH